ncbi:MAG: amidohydrolase family protein [Clostridia bacterium]|nr:amidohydrolase family protein [Clostridia bacterium]
MKIFDMHIHCKNTSPCPEKLIESMKKAGVYGGCVFSSPPKEQEYEGLGVLSFDERIEQVLSWTKGYEGRIFPVMWIHPFEENIVEKVHEAVKRGIVAFKMICTNYYVHDESSMALLREIAKLDVPVIFHTGILWDGNVSSQYNRPINWEALLDIEGIRFSMGHCSWPWVDECIALYGKFLHAKNEGKHVDMFFDITPGTPKLYREELLTKLYTIGYNVGDNVMFGLDSIADSYNSEWAKEWFETDGEILLNLGVSKENLNKLYCGNMMRFLGKKERTVEIIAPQTDDSHIWLPTEPNVKTIIEKWYKTLKFPSEYDDEFYRALDTVPISDAITLDAYDKDCKDGKRNLLSYLYMCENTYNEALKRGIPEEIILDTLSDVVTWCITWSNVKGELYLGELGWLSRHIGLKLFRLGRLQFCMGEADHDIPKYGIKNGDNVLEIHIPEGGKLTTAACEESISRAKEFFAKYFPKFEYTVFTCHSWLLDDTLKEFLLDESGIIRFGNMFDKVGEDESSALIRYLFTWNTTELNLKYQLPRSSLAKTVQKEMANGKKFHETLGVIPKG